MRKREQEGRTPKYLTMGRDKKFYSCSSTVSIVPVKSTPSKKRQSMQQKELSDFYQTVHPERENPPRTRTLQNVQTKRDVLQMVMCLIIIQLMLLPTCFKQTSANLNGQWLTPVKRHTNSSALEDKHVVLGIRYQKNTSFSPLKMHFTLRSLWDIFITTAFHSR